MALDVAAAMRLQRTPWPPHTDGTMISARTRTTHCDTAMSAVRWRTSENRGYRDAVQYTSPMMMKSCVHQYLLEQEGFCDPNDITDKNSHNMMVLEELM